MSSRVAELKARRELLRAQSAVQREELRLDAAVISDALRTIDRAVALGQRLARSPVVIGVAVVGLVLFRRHPVTGWVMRGLALAGTVRRVGRSLHRLADDTPASGPRER